MLYIPPRLAHWGIAKNDCITYSIGYRSPSIQEILGDLAETFTEEKHNIYYKDPPLTPDMSSNIIDPKFVHQIKLMLEDLTSDDELLADWFARYMTRSKYPELSQELKEIRLAKLGEEIYLNGKKQ
jgi:50S ribosomal protein L16 3-hydroxylase